MVEIVCRDELDRVASASGERVWFRLGCLVFRSCRARVFIVAVGVRVRIRVGNSIPKEGLRIDEGCPDTIRLFQGQRE